MRTTSKAVLAALVATGSLAVSGCGSSEAALKPDPANIGYARDHMLTRSDTESTVAIADTIPDLLPNHTMELFGNWVPNTHSVVVAVPTDIQPDKASAWDIVKGEDVERKVAFDDPNAMARTWLVTIEIKDLVAGTEPGQALPEASEDQSATVRLTGAGGKLDATAFRSGIMALGESVWFLSAFEDDPQDAFRVAWNGGAIGSITDDGSLAFVLLTPERRKQLKEETFTVESLRKAGAGPEVRVTIPEG
jgi:hypothetical protein